MVKQGIEGRIPLGRYGSPAEVAAIIAFLRTFAFTPPAGIDYEKELGDLIKNATYTGITPQFWAGCDAICNAEHWHVWGTPNCGKGQPSQTAHTGHGTAPARFRNVRVGMMT